MKHLTDLDTYIVLHTNENNPATKTFTKGFKKQSYNMQSWYYSHDRHTITNINELSSVLSEIENDVTKFWVNGLPRMITCLKNLNRHTQLNRLTEPKRAESSRLNPQWCKRRLKDFLHDNLVPNSHVKYGVEVLKSYSNVDENNFSEFYDSMKWLLIEPILPSFYSDRMTRVLPIDLDGISVNDLMNKDYSEKAVKEIIVKYLPECFHGVSCHYQWSSSAAIPNKKGAKANIHLWFMIDEHMWLRTINSIMGNFKKTNGLIDLALYRATQPVYTANPVFMGCTNPLKKRSGLITGRSDVVPLSDFINKDTPIKPKSDFDNSLSFINIGQETDMDYDSLLQKTKVVAYATAKSKVYKKRQEHKINELILKEKLRFGQIRAQGNNKGSKLCSVALKLFDYGCSWEDVYKYVEDLNADDHSKKLDGICNWAFSVSSKNKLEKQNKKSNLLNFAGGAE